MVRERLVSWIAYDRQRSAADLEQAPVMVVDHACPLYQLLPREPDSSRCVDAPSIYWEAAELTALISMAKFPRTSYFEQCQHQPILA